MIRETIKGWDLSATEALRGKRILFTGATGFVGKVALSMLLTRFPEVGKIYVLARPGVSTGADARFWGKVIVAPPFDPLRARLGPDFEDFVRSKCEPIAGDVSKKWCGFPDELLAKLEGQVDLLINSAGLVDFNPTLEAGLNANALGAIHVAETAKRIGAKLVHVSTCFVVGNAPGIVPEEEEILGYFPKRDERPSESFDPFAEIADCQATIARIKAEAEDKALLAELRAKAIEKLHDDGRDDGDAKAVRTGTMRERKVWTTERQVRAGLDRARYWGWPNTYCYSKSLGDQVIAKIAADEGLDFTIVRPAIVESALRFPFPGWNEGFTTTAPLSFLALKGHRTFPAKKGLILDVIPVDHIAAGVIAASAALLERKAKKVYQLGTSDTNPLRVDRAIELLGLYRRRHFLEKASKQDRLKNELLARIEPQAVPAPVYERRSAPEIAKLARKATELLDRVKPSWGAPRIGASIERLQDGLELTSRRAEMAAQLFEIFLPFIWENSFRFSTRNMGELYARMDPADAAKIPWDPEALDWLTYWLDVHLAGMERWIFPNLEDEFGVKTRKKGPPVHRDLWELLEARARRHPGKVAMRAYRKDGTAERYTYGQLRDRAVRASCYLVASGVAREDRVLLAAENRPEWAMAYFGGVHAGATLVPVDHQSSREELENVVRTSGAKVAVVSDAARARLGLDDDLAGARVIGLEQLFEGALPADVPFSPREPAELVSLIFTSGTTGKPKGVMLTQRNFTSLVSKLGGAFDLGERDGLLSVLPLHHTFEFTAGLLVPLVCGSEIAYLEELTGGSLETAFATGRITAMVGVPAVWQLLLRRIENQLADKGLLEPAQTLQTAVQGMGPKARSTAGKALFFPVHRKLGGRLRILISGGSAMPPKTYEAFQGMGFEIFEGYGLTEAAPVLTVQTKGENGAGHVGKPLPGIDVRIDRPDPDGVGEVVARGPNVMSGYWNDPAATAEVLTDGLLRTGDLGRFDRDGNLVIVGRQKDVIIDANGKNVYPDELEDLYAGCPEIKELSIVGLTDGGAEKVACLVVPVAPTADRTEAQIERAIEAHFREVGLRLAMWKRVKVLQFTRTELPRTATRKVKRPLVAQEIARLEQQKAGRKGAAADGDAWLYELVARVCEQPREKVLPESRLEQDLGFDSLMFTELGAALQSAGVGMPAPEEVMSIATVSELARKVAAWKRAAPRSAGGGATSSAPRSEGSGVRANARALFGSMLDAVQPSLDRVPLLASAVALARAEGFRVLDDLVPPGRGAKAEEPESIELPEVVVAAGKTVLRTGQRNLYENFFETKVFGRANVPQHANFLVAANHASHLDMGLVKHALGDQGENLVALAATDYFFSNKIRRAFFENFTQLIPMNRHGSLRESLELASKSLKMGRNLLIFPEGTRATDGTLKDFKGSLGYLALTNKVGILPVYLDGTYEALPKGAVVPKGRDLAAHIGPFLSYEDLEAAVAGLPRSEQHREIARRVEAAVRALEEGCRGGSTRATVTPIAESDEKEARR